MGWSLASGLFGNIEYRPVAELVLHGGAMLENNSMTGSSLSPRLAATYRVLPGHSLRAGVSRANRTPTLNEEKGSLIYASPSVLFPLTHGLPLSILALSSGGLIDERIISREIAYTVVLRPDRSSDHADGNAARRHHDQ